MNMATINYKDSVPLILNYFNSCNHQVLMKKRVVEEFLNYLKKSADTFSYDFLRNENARHMFTGIGSSYENTTTSSHSTFDIAMILQWPFDLNNFRGFPTTKVNMFMLKCLLIRDPRLSPYLDENHFLHTEKLRKAVFKELTHVLRNLKLTGTQDYVRFRDYRTRYEMLNDSFVIKLEKDQEVLLINIVPQIETRLEFIQELNIENLPEILKTCVRSTRKYLHLSISCPNTHIGDHPNQFALHSDISLLEYEAFSMAVIDKSIEPIRYGLCIAKTLSEYYKWHEKGLSSFHLKQVTLHVYDYLLKNQMEAWSCYIFIMDTLVTMLGNGGINSCYISNHDTFKKSLQHCQLLAQEITSVYMSTSPDNILEILRPGHFMANSSAYEQPTINVSSEGNNQLENQFQNFNITGGVIYDQACALPFENGIRQSSSTMPICPLVEEAENISLNKDNFNRFKENINEMKIEHFNKPSLYLEGLQCVAQNCVIAEDDVRTVFTEKITTEISEIMNLRKEISLPMIGKLADDIFKILEKNGFMRNPSPTLSR